MQTKTIIETILIVAKDEVSDPKVRLKCIEELSLILIKRFEQEKNESNKA